MIFKEAYIYVALQFAFIIAILIGFPLLSFNPILFSIQFLGIGLLCWAVFVMRKSRLNISPEVKKSASLVRSGPYKIIRHPMYLSTLLYMMPLVIDYFDYLRLGFLLALLISLILKLTFEEKLLLKSFVDYKEYQLNSWRLIPFVY